MVVVALAATCNTSPAAVACPLPQPGSPQDQMVQRVRSSAGFTILYPCELPLTQQLDSSAITGVPGRQQVELVWIGPFDLTVRQAQFPPAVSPDPSGSSRIIINLFSNVPATLIERNDGSGRALYHLFWKRDDIYYEVQAFGPPLQRRAIINVATSLKDYSQQQAQANQD